MEFPAQTLLPAQAPQGGALRLIALVLLCVFLASAAFAPRWLMSNRAHLLSWDMAEYAGAARDLLEYGFVEERTHSEALFHFLPLGYPVMIAAWVKAFGGTVHDAALRVNVAAGVLCCVLLFLFVRHATGSTAAALFAGLLAAGHARLIGISAAAMTDMPYMTCFLLLAWLTFALFASPRPRYVPGFFLAGAVFAAMYLLRVSALYLYFGIPFLFLSLALALRKGGARRFALGLLLFLAMGALAVGAVSWRLTELNGYFTLTPQIAANKSMGDFRNETQDDTFDLDESGLVVNWASRNVDSPGLAHAWLQDPAGRFGFFLDNVRKSFGFVWEGLWDGFVRQQQAWVRLALGLAVVLALIRTLVLGQGRRPLMRPDNRTDRVILAASILFFYVAAHMAAYSLLNSRVRYMWQTIPLLIAGMGLLMAVLQRLAWSKAPGRGGSSFLGLLAGGAVLAVWLGGAFLPQMNLDVIYRMSWTPPDRSVVPPEYQPMLDWAEAGDDAPRVLFDDAAAPYYGRAWGIIVPYTEDDPVKLMRYMDHWSVDFASIQRVTYVGPTLLDTPSAALLDALSGQFPDLAHPENDTLFRMGHLAPLGEPEVLETGARRVELKPGRYLLWMRFNGAADLELLLEDGNATLPGRLTLATARDAMGNESVYAAVAAQGLAAPALRLAPAPGAASGAPPARLELVPLPEAAP